nr:MAG TPA_asm: hypothetical protein [Caudoviricetes sp.]DAZ23892.1 MAG TPA: hypothetical protein [Caudoviricetes sp.]
MLYEYYKILIENKLLIFCVFILLQKNTQNCIKANLY